MKTVSSADVAQVAIDSITVGVRRRAKLGRLQSLERSIAKHGLIHPILLRNGNQLVAGQRRLEACRRLGWKTIPARDVDKLSDEELRAIEFDENREREALNTYDDSKQRLAEIRQAEADLKAKAVLIPAESKLSKRGRKGEGRPKADASQREVAKQLGTTQPAIHRVEKHVEIAERFPFMQRGGWKQHHVLEAGVLLDQLPDRDKSGVAVVLDQDAIPPKKAIEILANVVNLAPLERQEVFRLARSNDEHDRQTALTKAAANPPPVDPGLLLLGEAERTLQKAARNCRTNAFQSPLRLLADEAKQVLTAFQEANAHDRRSVSENESTLRPASSPA